jgi:hypothetical protein
MRPGSRWVYRATDGEGSRSRSVVTATGRTKTIANGILATALRDVVSEDGQVVEDAVEWYAQDRAGNVWYLGEDVTDYEDGRVTGTESWQAGVGGAQPGVVMPGRPRPGQRFRENHIPGDPGDRFEILSRREQAGVPFRHFDDVVLVKQTSPERDQALEYLFHARGAGLVLAIGIAGGSDRLELVRYRAGRAAAGGARAAAARTSRAARAGNWCGASAATPVPQPTHAHMAAAGLDRLPVAPAARRVDLEAPAFSDPTSVTNPLFPISRLASVVLNGRVDGKPFRTETTLLPDTRVIQWSPGQCVETLVSQYVAYLDGRIEEVALDFYAQADDGSVWYFGEDVYNYERGVVRDTSGTWLAGKEGPAAMIMPADPRDGVVHRPENIPGLVWEEVAVTSVGGMVNGPRGPVAGAMVGRELHDDGTFSDKVFAPGYGEFHSAHEGDVEALALAIPTDALPGPAPRALQRLSRAADRVFRAAFSKRWRTASAGVREATAAWEAHRRDGVPHRLIAPTRRAITALTRAVRARDGGATRNGALDVTQAALDLELRYRPAAEIDRARFDLWARQIRVDAAAGDRAAISGDVATLEWIRDRIARGLDSVAVTRLDTRLEALRGRLSDGELGAVARIARGLLTRSGR